jgi:hypothetical protein
VTTFAWFIVVLTAIGTSMLTSLFMEAYFQRRGQDEVGLYDKGMEDDSAHRAS